MGEGLPVPERILCDLLYRHWCMTVEGSPPQEKYVAFRPLNWNGEGDPFERITAPTRTELLRRLAHRHLGIPQDAHRCQGEPIRRPQIEEEKQREQDQAAEEVR